MAGVEIKNGSCDPDHAPFRVVCHPKARIWNSISKQNLTILALTVPKIWLVPTKI